MGELDPDRRGKVPALEPQWLTVYLAKAAHMQRVGGRVEVEQSAYPIGRYGPFHL